MIYTSVKNTAICVLVILILEQGGSAKVDVSYVAPYHSHGRIKIIFFLSLNKWSAAKFFIVKSFTVIKQLILPFSINYTTGDVVSPHVVGYCPIRFRLCQNEHSALYPTNPLHREPSNLDGFRCHFSQ